MQLVILGHTGLLGQCSPPDQERSPQWLLDPLCVDALARLNHGTLRVAIATNQAAIAGGVLGMTMLNGIHQRMLKQVHAAGGRIEAIALCPHAPAEHCHCRKPRPGMLQDLIERFGVEARHTVMLGDSLRDMNAALAAGCQAWLLRTGHGQRMLDRGPPPAGVEVMDNLSQAVDAILAQRPPPERDAA